MTDTNVFQLSQPGNFADPLTEVLRKGARELLARRDQLENNDKFMRHLAQVVRNGLGGRGRSPRAATGGAASRYSGSRVSSYRRCSLGPWSRCRGECRPWWSRPWRARC